MKKSWEHLFAAPDKRFRSIPFWSWNDRLTEQELAWQIREMADKNIGGFFMHSRDGLETEYMGKEWMTCVKASVEAAKKNGMTAYIYDEDRWPSGAAGGLVSACGDEYRMKALVIFLSDSALEGEYLYSYAIAAEETELKAIRPFDGNLREGERFLGFKNMVYDKCEWFNDETYSDNMNPNCVRKFLELVYDRYDRLFDGKLSKAVGGIFTDEPNIHGGRSAFTFTNGFVPWTDRFPEEFKKRRGYEISECVPYLFFEHERSFKSRHDFWRTAGELFTESYMKQIYEWCDSRGVAFTGHFLYENDLGTATRCSGGVMKNYRYQHIPGMDLLTDQNGEYLTIRQCASVARQLGRKTAISEMYGCTGWQSDFDMQRRIGDWHAVQGVNLRCQHLALYSLRGCRKRDYPASFNYNTTWWSHLGTVENYFERLNSVLSAGDAVRDLLILHPQATAWGMLGSDLISPSIQQDGRVHLNKIDSHMQRVDQYGHRFNSLLKTLYTNHIDFDLGDDTILEELGSVTGNKLTVGACTYRTVLIPQVDTLVSSTYQLLRQFAEQGGRVVILTPLPTRLDGEVCPELRFKGFELCPDPQELLTILQGSLHYTNADGKEINEVVFMHRREGEADLIFAVNLSREREANGRLTLDAVGTVYEADCMTGKLIDYGNLGEEGFILRLKPGESRLLAIDSRKIKRAVPPTEHNTKAISFGQEWEYELTASNLLVLDRCAAWLGSEPICENTDVWKAQSMIRERLGMRQIYYNGLPQRYRWADLPHENDGADVRLCFRFEVEQLPKDAVYAVIERAESFEVLLNGVPGVHCDPGDYFLDKAFGKVRLSGLRLGRNTLEIRCRYKNSYELEDIFLAGQFGVNESRQITALPFTLKEGDWCTQGLPYYCGSVIYRKELELCRAEAVSLTIPPISAAVSELRVNGRHCAYLIEKYSTEHDISEYLRQGSNLIELEVVGTPKNMLGPLHEVCRTPAWTDWRDFRTEGEAYYEGYNLIPFGINPGKEA